MTTTEPPAPVRERAALRLPGALSVFLGSLGLLAVLCLRWPAWLTTPELRAVYPMPLVRTIIAMGLALALAFGAAALLGRSGRRQGAAGIALALVGLALGGSGVPVAEPVPPSHHLGLDWFVLDLFVLSLIFVPLERWFTQRAAQPILRPGWRTDTGHFFVSHVGVQLLTFLSMAPAVLLFREANFPALQDAVASSPLWLQLPLAVLVADLGGWIAHRTFHAVPALWPFHAIHHSSESMDWLAGSRLHLVDVIVTRAAAFCPLLLLGFSQQVLSLYLVWVAMQATFIHANIRFGFGPLRFVLVSPQFHHWHHAAETEGRDKNFAVHTPLIDWMFGTLYLPGDRWPARYGLTDDAVPERWAAQLTWPLRRRAAQRQAASRTRRSSR